MTDELNPDALHKALNELQGWSGTKAGITKSYRFDADQSAAAFVERISALADRMDHHPDITTNGAVVELTLVTHSAGGVTQKDLDLAAAIDTGEAHGDANRDNPAAGQTA